MDTTLRLTNISRPSETMHAHEILHADGGKGTNQAVATKRSDAQTSFTGSVGADSEGQRLLDLLAKKNIDTSGVAEIQGAITGQAMIMVDAAGESSVLVHVGANNTFHEQEVLKDKQLITNSNFIIVQFGSNLDAAILAFSIAKGAGRTTILNPTPARGTIPTELLEKTDITIPNKTGTEIITGIRVTDHNSLVAAAEKLHELGIGTIITTLGSAGAFYHTEREHGIAPAFKMGTVDTAATGDTFIGALSGTLQPDLSNLKEAILYEDLASSIAVQSYGAQPSIPYREALE